MKKLFGKEKWAHLFYTVMHPSDGYYWIRHREKGSVGIAVLLVLFFGLCFSLNRLLASFVVSDVNVRTVNLLPELGGVVLMYLLLCVGNWSITCLMDGEGRFKDICIAVGYAMLPMIVTYILATIVSQFLAEGEQAFYTIIMGIGVAYTLIMALTGIMQVHNYTLGKTLLTLFLTLVAVFIIIFLVLLITNFVGQVIAFFQSIYTELIFRF
ncbi:MAG: YIP1 family protein [Clostridia bacterium]|nr:YIP1 family protein [Clostridia bacterium]